MPPRKRHQISGAEYLASSRSVCSSIRQSAMPPPGQPSLRLDPGVAVMSAGNPELSNLAL